MARATFVIPNPNVDLHEPENREWLAARGWAPNQHVRSYRYETDDENDPEFQHEEDDPIIKDEFCDVWSVAIYEAGLSYGGPEEGGWWFEQGTLQELPVLYFDNRSDAIAAMNFVQDLMDVSPEWNKNRPAISSVNSYGVFRARINDGHPVKHYPARRPHYE